MVKEREFTLRIQYMEDNEAVEPLSDIMLNLVTLAKHSGLKVVNFKMETFVKAERESGAETARRRLERRPYP